MSVPDENLTKCTLLVQRSPQALIDYYTMLFPPHFIHQIKHTRETERQRDRETERQRDRETERQTDLFIRFIIKHIFMKRKQNISSLHKIACSLVSLFLLYIMKVVAACKVSSVFNHISPSF